MFHAFITVCTIGLPYTNENCFISTPNYVYETEMTCQKAITDQVYNFQDFLDENNYEIVNLGCFDYLTNEENSI